jgi:hypothetical protein
LDLLSLPVGVVATAKDFGRFREYSRSKVDNVVRMSTAST